ncbi:MAG: CAP domain-containing protein [Planctomycetota bacterium]
MLRHPFFALLAGLLLVLAAGESAAQDPAGRAAALRRAFERAGPAERDALFDELLAAGFTAELRAGLQTRWNALAARLASNAAGRRLRQVAATREELDRRREAALALIFDEEQYFYPYDPPECPPEKAALYAGVQRRVDELVGAVRETWADDTRVAVRGELAAILDEANWLVRREDEWGKASILPDDLPYWILGLDPTLESIGLAEFAWDEDERAALARSRAVVAANRARWEADEVGENGRAATVVERRQVEITNDYRLLLGRAALAWNPRIQAAAADHSEYMANTGDFGHDEPDPDRRGPKERMHRRGYAHGAGENCHAGGGDPMGAHVGWCHSSGHHRNILAAEHTEMASGLVGSYWTQNFGTGTVALAERSE